jgi:hypothetical protein
MANLKQVLLAIRHGNLLEQIASFEDDQLRPFLPFLVQIGFSNNAPNSSELVKSFQFSKIPLIGIHNDLSGSD